MTIERSRKRTTSEWKWLQRYPSSRARVSCVGNNRRAKMLMTTTTTTIALKIATTVDVPLGIGAFVLKRRREKRTTAARNEITPHISNTYYTKRMCGYTDHIFQLATFLMSPEEKDPNHDAPKSKHC